MIGSVRHTTGGKERREIRAALHGERPAVQVGKNGVDEALVASAEQALAAREAIKVRVGGGCPLEPAEVAEALAIELKAEVVAITGGTILLYRPQPEEAK